MTLTSFSQSTNQNDLTYGVIGTGMMGQEHLLNLLHLPGATVTAMADPHPESLQQAQAIWPEAQVFAHYRDLLDSGLCQAVVLATPNHTHADLLEDILLTDLPVLVEKPLAITIGAGKRLLELSQARTALTWVGLEYRYIPAIARLIREARAGTAGRLHMVAIREHRFPFLTKVGDWNRFAANTGGTLVEKCCHFFDLMTHILNQHPVRVFASGAQNVNHLDEVYQGRRPDIIDNAYVIVDFSAGGRAMLDLCMFAEATEHQEEVVVVGDLGKIEALVPPNLVRVGRRGTHWIGEVESYRCHDPRIKYEGGHHGSSYLEHLDFQQAVREGLGVEVSVEQGLLSVAVGLAAQQSLKTGLPVKVDQVLGSTDSPSTPPSQPTGTPLSVTNPGSLA